MMEEYYMSRIFNVFGLIENQGLTVAEQKDKIVDILSEMRKEVREKTTKEVTKSCAETIHKTLNDMLL